MDRITDGHIERKLRVLNILVNIQEPSWNVPGSYLVNSAYDLIGIEKVSANGGAEKIIPLGTKRETYESLTIYIKGYQTALEMVMTKLNIMNK